MSTGLGMRERRRDLEQKLLKVQQVIGRKGCKSKMAWRASFSALRTCFGAFFDQNAPVPFASNVSIFHWCILYGHGFGMS